jgi:endonuclease I
MIESPNGLVKSSDDYYSGIDASATGDVLRTQLQALISVKTTVSYDGVWKAFESVDKFLPGYPCSPDPEEIPDIYSSFCWKTEKVVPGGECGNYKVEGDCFNREHSWPKSWFGGFSEGDGAQTDLFELYPSDGKVNGLRANYPLGYVKEGTATYTSTNNSKLGECASSGYTGTCFELPDYLKGDLARTYFYLATAYYKVWGCCDEAGVDKWEMKKWMEDDMRAWHEADPVTDQERARNEEIYANHQHNRNPYIDHPEWVNQISDF